MAQTAKITGWHVLGAMVAFFGTIIVANAIFITAAVRSFPGESQKKSYVQGLRYNDVLAERAAQEALGWRAEVVLAERRRTGGEIALRLYGEDGRALENLSVSGELNRPAHDHEDRALRFEDWGGVYRASVEALAPGAWDLRARAENAAGDVFDIHSRIIVE